MKHFSRLVLAYTVFCLSFISAAFGQHIAIAQNSPALLGHSSQGYLGIVCSDIDNHRASELKLKGATGAEIINVDHDAPAGKAGLRPHDVILQVNGQVIAGEAQLRKMLLGTSAGHTITLLISRDGQQQTVAVQLADRAVLEQDAWSQHMVVPAPEDDEAFSLEGSSGHGFGSGFFGIFSLGSPSVGLDLDVLGSQLADYFGVRDGQGLLVKRVAEDSPAERAGLKAGDVITKANGKKMATLGEWMKMLHANRGKQVQITLIRNRKEQTIVLLAGNSKNHGELLVPSSLPWIDGNDAELAELDVQIDPEGFLRQMLGTTEDAVSFQRQFEEQGQEFDRQMRELKKEVESLNENQAD